MKQMNSLGRHHAMSPLLAGAICGILMILVVGVMAKINIAYSAPWVSTHVLKMDVSNADAMANGSDVRIAGRLIGQVTSVNAQGNQAEVSMQINDSEWPLPSDTSASVRLATLLGQKYVELVPGTSQSHLADASVIGIDATHPVVDFDQVLNTFNDKTRSSLTSLIRTLGTPQTGALTGPGEDQTLQQLIPSLADLATHSNTPTGELAKRDPELNSILINLAATSDSLAGSSADLAGTINSLNSVTGALAAHQTALESYISNNDALNQTANAILGGPGAAQLNAGLQQLNGLTKQADGLFTTLIPETKDFQGNAASAAVNLIWEVGDATSQSSKSGFFLRQNLVGTDPSGLLPPGPAPVLPTAPVAPAPLAPSTCTAAYVTSIGSPTIITPYIALPLGGAAVSGHSVVFDAGTTSGSPTSLQYLVDGKPVGAATPTIYGWIFIWNSTTVPNGVHTVSARATDAVGDVGISSGVTVTVSGSSVPTPAPSPSPSPTPAPTAPPTAVPTPGSTPPPIPSVPGVPGGPHAPSGCAGTQAPQAPAPVPQLAPSGPSAPSIPLPNLMVPCVTLCATQSSYDVTAPQGSSATGASLIVESTVDGVIADAEPRRIGGAA